MYLLNSIGFTFQCSPIIFLQCFYITSAYCFIHTIILTFCTLHYYRENYIIYAHSCRGGLLMFMKYGDSPKKNLNGTIDKTKPLVINSCGTYRLYTRKELPTGRSHGRQDYQLIYIAAGKGHFYFEADIPTILNEGTMILYCPEELQNYVYYGKDTPEVYWIHFTGSEAERIFTEHGITPSNRFFSTGTNPEYAQIFEKIILELQLQKEYFEESTSLLFRQLLVTVGRHLHEVTLDRQGVSSTEIIQATGYLHEHYHENINIEEYIKSHYASTSSFFRKFKLCTGITPLQYLLDIRLSIAKDLLETTDYSINEIASLVGYDNALYFSRLFHKHTGLSPRDYRKHHSNLRI